MNSATLFEDQRRELERVRGLYAAQPAPNRRAFDEAGQAVAGALQGAIFRLALAVPLAAPDGGSAPYGAALRLQAGSWWSQQRKSLRRDDLIERLTGLAADADLPTANAANIIRFTAGNALARGLPSSEQLDVECVAFDGRGRLRVSEREAAALVERLGQWMERLRLIARVFPPWATDDAYNAASERLSQALTQQGRSLARLYNEQLIEEVSQGWKTGQIARSLTLLVPYLDESTYRVERFPVVVMPAGRIPFRPEFVVSACRIAERQARSLGNLTQSTRWQLVTHLDQIAQAFENRH